MVAAGRVPRAQRSPVSADMCGRWIIQPVVDGMATISREQCHLPAGHFGPCLSARQVLA